LLLTKKILFLTAIHHNGELIIELIEINIFLFLQ